MAHAQGAPSEGPLRILVAGDVEGRFQEFFNRVRTVETKNGPFSMLLCVGQFFDPEASASSTLTLDLKSPLPTFILGPHNLPQAGCYPDLSGCEIGENITYLGKGGLYTTSSGLRLVYLSGTQRKGGGENEVVTFGGEDVRDLLVRSRAEANTQVDILLTSQWPKGIETHSLVKPSPEPQDPSVLISQLTLALKPQYHFCGTEGIHYERPPYRNHIVLSESSKNKSVTRFVGLAKVGNSQKRKWLYAFTITPLKTMSSEALAREPSDVTDCPYTTMSTASLELEAKACMNPSNVSTASPNQFFYDTSYDGNPQNRGRGRGGRGRGRGRGGYGDGGGGKRGPGDDFHGPPRKMQNLPEGTCWFCLASPEVEKHLVISVGDSVYLTLAKGGLTPDHILILPIGHFGSVLEAPGEVVDEIERFKAALKSCFATRGQILVFFERNFKSPHCQIQVVPLDAKKFSEPGLLRSLCLDYAESEGIEMTQMPPNAELFHMARPGFPYFLLELPDGSRLFHSINVRGGGNRDGGRGHGPSFPLQFGRELLASDPILNCPDKIDWKSCKVNKEEETSLTTELRLAFKPFEFA